MAVRYQIPNKCFTEVIIDAAQCHILNHPMVFDAHMIVTRVVYLFACLINYIPH